MKNQKIKNIIILLTVILAGFLIFSYYSKPKESLNNSENTQNQEEVTTIVDKNKDTGSVTQSSDLEQKFNASMVSARNAMLKADYSSAIKYYNQALEYKQDDTAYAGLFTVYLTQKNWQKAFDSVNKAISISPVWGDYWKWKILVMNEGLKATFTDLKKVYEEGYLKTKTEEKINLVTYFASIASSKNQKEYAISLWQKAIELSPENKATYQAEIDRLNK